MSDFLQAMAKSSAERAAMAPTFADADFDKPVVPLALGAFDVIAEIKLRSPAEGELGVGQSVADIEERARVYSGGGAAAIGAWLAAADGVAVVP